MTGMGDSGGSGKAGSGIWPLLTAAACIALVMAACLPTEPLFYSNQHTKFLHGFAQAGFGFLDEDWQAWTKNGLPLFTAIVYAVAATAPKEAFYLLQFLTFWGFAAAALMCWRALARERYGEGTGDRLLWPVAALIALTQISQPLGKLWQGVANQYILDRMFEPASFGSLLLVAVALFLGNRAILAALAIVAAAAMHPGYVIPGAALLFGFAVVALTEPAPPRAWPLAVSIGLAGLIATFLYLQFAFKPTEPGLRIEAAAIIAKHRIPDHSLVSEWFDIDAWQKLIAVLAACWLARSARYGRLLLAAFGLTAALTLVAMITGSPEIALIAPWRTSTVLAPLANVVLLGALAVWIERKLAEAPPERAARLRRRLGLGVRAVLALAVVMGAALKAPAYLWPTPAPDLDFARAERASGQLYLTPIDRSEFRLETGAPQYVNWKTHPYLDVEVIEWWRRIETARDVYAAPALACEKITRLAREEAVTHVFLPTGAPLEKPCAGWAVVHEDDRTTVYAYRGDG